MMKCVQTGQETDRLDNNGRASTAAAGLNTSSEEVQWHGRGGDGTDHGESGVDGSYPAIAQSDMSIKLENLFCSTLGKKGRKKTK